jgi:hypothetical protein
MVLMNQVVRINNPEFTRVNTNAFFGVMIPLGISLMAVLGFSASHFLSRYLLKAMAALRAKTIQRITSSNLIP